MNKFRVSINFTELALLILCFSPTAHATQNCSNLLQDYINWAAKPDVKPINNINLTVKGERYFIGLMKTTNSNNRKFASFATATLDYQNGTLVGTGRMWFSDRERCPVNILMFNPFCGKPDDVRITLSNHTDPLKISVQIDLLTWGAQESFEAKCENGHIYGFTSDQHGTHLVDITLSKEKSSNFSDPTK